MKLVRPAKIDTEGKDIPPLIQPNNSNKGPAIGIMLIIFFLVGSAILLGIFIFYDKFFIKELVYIPDYHTLRDNLTMPDGRMYWDDNNQTDMLIAASILRADINRRIVEENEVNMSRDMGWYCYVPAGDVVNSEQGTGFHGTQFCKSNANAYVGEGTATIYCDAADYQTNDCWEFWSVYTVQCVNQIDFWTGSFDIDWYANLTWATGGQLIDTGLTSDYIASVSMDCDSDCGDPGEVETEDCTLYTYARCGYCGLPYKTEDIKGTARVAGSHSGTSTATTTVTLMPQESNYGSPQIYKKSAFEDRLKGQMTQTSGYLPAHQFLQYIKGSTTYGTNYTEHSETWDGLCLSQNLCTNTSYWDDYSEQGSYVDDRLTDNECSVTCTDSLTIATINDTLDNHFPVLIEVNWDSLEITLSGNTYPSLSWRGAFNDDMLAIVAGYKNDSYYVYHPFNQKQNWTYGNLTTYFKGAGCYIDCNIDSDLDAYAITIYAYDTATLMPDAFYESGGIFEPNAGCWDADFDGDYENATAGDTCYWEELVSDCNFCPDVGVSYEGNTVEVFWDKIHYIQKNDSGAQDIAFTAISIRGETSADREVIFTEDDITIQWLQPTMYAYLTPSADDDDENDDGIVPITKTIGFNASTSTSDGPNNYTKIYGSIWDITNTSTGYVVKWYCYSNESDASTWCETICPSALGCIFYEVPWDDIVDYYCDYTGNFTTTMQVVTKGYESWPGAGWSAQAQLNFSCEGPILIPRFDNITRLDSQNNTVNVTDWDPASIRPIIFNMNKTIFNEDYIDWIIMDTESNDMVDACWARDTDAKDAAMAEIDGEWDPEVGEDNQDCDIPSNVSTANNLQLLPLTITPEIIGGWANIARNVSIKMGTALNISGWVKHAYQYESSVLIADIDLIDSDSGTWDTKYGDTIWYDMNTTTRSDYKYDYFDITEYDLDVHDCHNNILIRALCKALGIFGWDEWCYCVTPVPTETRLWNHSPIIGVCYDYTDDGDWDKCFESQQYISTGGEHYDTWGIFNMSTECSIACNISPHPEDEDWYLNHSLGIGTGSGDLKAIICNLYGDCDYSDIQPYSFEAPDYYADCRIKGDVQITSESTTPLAHKETASTIIGRDVNISLSNSSASNAYFPIRYALITYYSQHSNYTSIIGYEIAKYRYWDWVLKIFTWWYTELDYEPIYQSRSYHTVCHSAEESVCQDICQSRPYSICDDYTVTDWDTILDFSSTYSENMRVVIMLGYDWYYNDDGYYAYTECTITWGEPYLFSCIGPSAYDDDLDDDFKVFINATTKNATIGFDPNCAVIWNRTDVYTGLDYTNPQRVNIYGENESLLNESISYTSTLEALINQSGVDIIYNISTLNVTITGTCWDYEGDTGWDAYAGYVDCFDPSIEGGGLKQNITTFCNTTLNLSTDWNAILNITRNDTNVTTVRVTIFDKCGSHLGNATQTAYWDRGTTPLLCFNAVKDDENNEIYTSGINTTSDYGGTCGLCTDGILNNAELKANYENSGYDYGGKWCGYCNLDVRRDDIWLAAVKEYGLTVPFDDELCEKIEGPIAIIAIFLIIIMLILLLALLFILLLIGIPIIITLTKTTIAIIMLIRRLRKVVKKKKTYQKLARLLRRK